jgi:hypothetical protein
MSVHNDSPTLRDSVDELDHRLTRVAAAASTLRLLAPEIRHGVPPAELIKLVEDLDRDLMLASSQVELVHERAVLEFSSARSA